MIRTLLVIAAMLCISSAPLAAKHKHHRRSSGFTAFFSFGDGYGRGPAPRYYRGDRHYDRHFDGRGYYTGFGYYDDHRRFHKHKRKHFRKYRNRHYNAPRYRRYNYCPYH